MIVQLRPPSIVLNSRCDANNNTCGSTGENTIGAVRSNRSVPSRITTGPTFCTSPVRSSNRVTLPP